MITVSTRDFEMAHGKTPRGRGSWAFFFDGKKDIDDAVWYNGTYREALAMAHQWAVKKGYTLIEVGS